MLRAASSNERLDNAWQIMPNLQICMRPVAQRIRSSLNVVFLLLFRSLGLLVQQLLLEIALSNYYHFTLLLMPSAFIIASY